MSWTEHRVGDRALYVLAPPTDEPVPAVFLLHPMTSQVRTWFNVSPFEASPADQLAALGVPAVLVLVDGWTAEGGGQWIGPLGTYLTDEVVPFVDAHHAISARALAGRSSGGFGSMVWAMQRPDLFHGFATHAGDAHFDVTYRSAFPAAAQALRNLYGGSLDAFWEDFRSGRPVFASRTDPMLQDVGAMATAFSDGVLPFDVETGELVPEVWQRWLAWDPVLLAPRHAEALRGLDAIWIDAGKNDEYYLDLGATAFHRAVVATGAAVGHFELHEGGHRGTNRRLLESVPWLVSELGDRRASSQS